MALAALGWSSTKLAEEAKISRPTVARFVTGGKINPESIEAMRRAFEAKRVRFIMSGPFKGGVAPPPRGS